MNTGINSQKGIGYAPMVKTVAITLPASISAMIREYESMSPNQPVTV